MPLLEPLGFSTTCPLLGLVPAYRLRGFCVQSEINFSLMSSTDDNRNLGFISIAKSAMISQTQFAFTAVSLLELEIFSLQCE